ncbi:peptide chain release factor 1 [Anaeroplasma bactoclasticum]|uniref:Peptide chain release factor 1 n=1 Tax=Anaeroplasma bactoclasticum TaxID=2088 RepID=A0A397QW66_9MOLU|nr:peptide chain release factor 1 [Anaeroplasma bactoclasticum]RIA65019.1 peptide chain release factor 1 [Anaeroplasma bactoclasticum]
MLDRLKMMEARYNEINDLLMQPETAADVKKLTALSKEQKSLEKVVTLFHEQQKLEASIPDLKEMKKEADPEIVEMATMELEEAQKRLVEIEDEIKVLLLPKDPNDEKDVVVEIRGAVGGDEANIFAGDLFRMYTKYAESKGWKITVFDAMESDQGGYSNIQFKVSGESVYSFLKYESGGHRVQRIPVTEANGRIQTSIATVLVMPEAEEIDFQLEEKDLRIDTFCSSGPGGQGVNTTYSAVRVTYIPTGDFVACQIYRSQHENKATAMEILRTRIYERMLEEEAEKTGATRQSLIGHGERSEKIRTYNYPQNRVTDHRIGFTINRLDAIIDGKLDLVISELINEDQKRKLSSEEEIKL